MNISKYNHEGYHDPTVYEALVNIEKERKEAQKLVPGRYRPLVYICSPYAGDVLNNERKARRYCQFAVRKRRSRPGRLRRTWRRRSSTAP